MSKALPSIAFCLGELPRFLLAAVSAALWVATSCNLAQLEFDVGNIAIQVKV